MVETDFDVADDWPSPYCSICGSCGCDGCGCEKSCKYSTAHPDSIRAVEEAVASERERCAQVIERLRRSAPLEDRDVEWNGALDTAAQAVRKGEA